MILCYQAQLPHKQKQWNPFLHAGGRIVTFLPDLKQVVVDRSMEMSEGKGNLGKRLMRWLQKLGDVSLVVLTVKEDQIISVWSCQRWCVKLKKTTTTSTCGIVVLWQQQIKVEVMHKQLWSGNNPCKMVIRVQNVEEGRCWIAKRRWAGEYGSSGGDGSNIHPAKLAVIVSGQI